MSQVYLITGGAGFIGSNFVDYIYNKYPDSKIIVLDLLTYAGNIEYLPEKQNCDRFEFWYGDIKNTSLVESLVSQSDYVIHFAAETHVTRSISDNKNFFETDVLGTQVISNAVLKYMTKVKKFIHVSTSEVYGNAQEATMDENHPLNPTSPYAAAKAGADRLVYSYFITYNIPAVIVRPFNNYGPRQHLEKLIPRFISNILIADPLCIHGNGEASRDWVYVEDTCRAIDMILTAPLEDVQGEVFNIATGKSYSILEIADELLTIMKPEKLNKKFDTDRPGQVHRHTGDYKKIRELLGWEPEIDFEQGLIKTVSWFKENQTLWEKQMWLKDIPITLPNGQKIVH
ncbi:dTDP-glucose 4,6-dehydratase [Candidatus Marinarcus aquaticus]|uniref:Epimerase n=1 Tax=Candidatus Marinarcus aquaticus TaxID=2044504 RepID=A0A4Q0XRA1_9BACT|nr:GDP-mannose 4,6-dehydratase [Candidatus Marinarcus aquaticus]RXJ55388.1 epimerase [Candidatus Marinarcus aquaticus]